MICPGPIRLCPAQNDQNFVRAHVVKFGSLLVWVFCRRPRSGPLISKRASCHAHRASRARMRTSSPRIARIVTVSVPPAHDRHARATTALARSIDRARSVALAMAVKEAVGYTARHVRHEKLASLVCTSTPSTRIVRLITDFRSPRARASCGGGGARSSSLDRAHEVWHRRWRWR